MSDDSHAQLVNHVEREEAEQLRWNALRSTGKRHTPRIDRVDDVVSFAQYTALALALTSFLLACF